MTVRSISYETHRGHEAGRLRDDREYALFTRCGIGGETIVFTAGNRHTM